MQIFYSNNKKHDFDHKIKLHWDFDVSFFLKIDTFEGPKPHSPLIKTISTWNTFN